MIKESTRKKVSIIVPIYGVEKYLFRCLDSIINQTYDNLEIILVDDGSQDKSGEICDHYARKDKRIIVIHQENMGQSEARNNAIKRATGEYYVFVDADDEVPSHMVENLLVNCERNNSQICIGDFDFFTDNFDFEDKNYIEHNPQVHTGYDLLSIMHTFPGEKYVVMWGKIFKAELFDTIAFPKGRICEDLAVLYKLYDKASNITLMDHVVYGYYRGNETSATFSLSDKYYQDVYTALNEEIDYMNKNHPELVCYPAKIYMYWLISEYRAIFKLKKRKDYMKKLYIEYCSLYDLSRNLSKERFYIAFRYFPNLYCFIKEIRS